MYLLCDNTHHLTLNGLLLLFIKVNVFLIDYESLSPSRLLVDQRLLDQVRSETVICRLEVLRLLLLVAHLPHRQRVPKVLVLQRG